MHKAARIWGAAITAAIGLVGVRSGHAAETTQASLEEVIVTAERRAADLQDTPISIASFNAGQIEQVGAQGLEGLQTYVPNFSVTYDAQYGRSNPQFNIRGVGSGVLSAGVVTERAVGLYIDGVYFSRVQGSLLSLIDAERIDVLRGPQGTLFGRNTTGGAIVYTSKMPSRDFEGFAKVKVGEFSQREAQVMVNVPLSDTVFLRGMYADVEQDGYVSRGDIDLGNVDDKVGRLQLRVEPTQSLTIDLSATYSEMRTNGDPRVLTEFNLNGLAPASHFAALDILLRNQGAPGLVEDDPRIVRGDYSAPAFCILDDTNPFTFGSQCETTLEGELGVGTARVQWDASDTLSFTSITGYLSGEQVSSSDWVWTGAYYRPFSFDYSTLSQEFQLNWNTERLKFVAGAIYFDEDATEAELTTEISRTGGAFGLTQQQILAGARISRRDETYRSQVNSYGTFAQATWSITERLDLTGGVRYSRDTKDVTIQYRPTINDPRSATGRGEKTWSDTDWRVAVDFDITDSVMVYVSATDAYKAGIADDSALEISSNTSGIIAFIPPESALGYEAGMRSEWLDRRLRLNASLYRTDYSDRQSSQLINDPNTGVLIIQSINLGDVNFEGFELDFAAAVTDDLTITGAYGQLDYEIEQQPANVLANVPKESWTLGATHSLELGGAGSLLTSLNYGWVDSSYADSRIPDVQSQPRQALNPSYGLLSGRMEFTSDSRLWSVALYGTNLLDEVYATSAIAQDFHMGQNGRTVRGFYRGRPRSLGVEGKIRF